MKKLELSKILTKNSDKKFYIYIFLAFILSIYFRWDYIGEISEGHHQWITGMTLLTIENWMEDGIINDYLVWLATIDYCIINIITVITLYCFLKIFRELINLKG